MKSKKKQNIVRVLFLLVLFFVGNYFLANPINNKVNRETNSYTLTNVDILKTSGHWNLSPFVIDDSGGGDYTWEEASAETWCSGSGTLEEPHLIENVTIDGENSGSCITIKNSEKYFRIENCTVFNSGSGDFDAGIHLYYVGNGTLINNNCSFNNNNGIILYHSCFNNTISGNFIHDNVDEGIHVRYSLYNTFSENTIYNHAGYYGLYFYNSHNNTFNDNMAYSNSAGIWIHVSDNNTVFNNTFYSNSYGISLRYGHYSKIFSNNVSENTYGIHIDNTRYCDIYENTIENSVNDGIWIHDVSADNNTIYANNINSNGRYGVYIDNSDCLYNEIYLNNFNDNNINAYDHGTDTKWDNGIIGNYWDDYKGYDINGDGIGEIPYVIPGGTGGQDNFPIWSVLAPIYIDGTATGMGAYNWTWASNQLWCSGKGTEIDPYIIANEKINGLGSSPIFIENSDVFFIIDNCILFNSTINVDHGGICLDNCKNGKIYNNRIFNTFAAIHIKSSSNNTVSENNCSSNGRYGIRLESSNNNTFSWNDCSSNDWVGIHLKSSNNDNIFIRNNCSSNGLYGIESDSSNNNDFLENDCSFNGKHGINVYSSSNDNTISGNTAKNNQDNGIRLYDSDNNTVSGNIVENNVNYGIYIASSDYNLIYRNYFINNGIHALDEGISNNWNSSIIGNYWDNYTGYDDDLDGIGDTPHNFGTGIDYLPIWNFQSPIHIDDSPASPIDWAWAETQPWCSGSGTFSDPYIIDGLNITARGVGNGILIENSNKYFVVQNCKLIESGSGTYDAGILLDHAGNGTLINNNCSFNKHGIYLYYSDITTVSGNTANNNQYYGIYLYYSDNNTISGNTANNNQYYGIKIDYSAKNTVSGNNAYDNHDIGIYLLYSVNNTVSGNTVNNQIQGILLYYSDNNKVSGNTANNGGYGIYSYNSDNNTVSGNTLNKNKIYLSYSGSTTVSGNIINNNVQYGIKIDTNSDYNLIYQNYFINNGIHALDEGNSNNWNSSIIGNYWDNYMGYDDDLDGIGDTPHDFGTGFDYLPIWNLQSPIHIDDSPASPIDWVWAETQPWCSGSGTFSDPYVIDGLNITAKGVGNGILIENSYKYFIVQNCKLVESRSGDYDAGIRLDHAGNGTLINNNCSFNRIGIYIDISDNTTISGNTANNNSYYGIYLYDSHNATVSGNTANNNQDYGIYIYYSDNNTISGNTANNNRYYGINIKHSDNNNVSGNTANDGGYGILLSYSFYNNVSRNTANNIGGYGIYILLSDNNTVSGNTVNNGGYGIYILLSDNNTVSRNTVNNQSHGILLYYSDNTTISGNTVNNNKDYGICINLSNSTTVSGNIVDNNVNYGIIIVSGYYNLFYKNYFNDNNINAYDNGTDNEWDNGIIGNYWDDYGGVDANDNGIGDTPYIILGTAGSQDNLPIWADGDDIPPVITIISPLHDSEFSLDAPNYQITIGELNLDTIWYTLNGGGTNYTITGLTGTFNQLAWGALSEGNITIRFYANDTAGHIGSAAVTVEKDISAPVITIILPLPDNVFGLVAPNYNISIDDLNLDTIWYTLDGGLTNYTITDLTGTFNQLAWGALSEGSLTIRFYANDTAGNIGFTDVEVIIEIPEDLDGVPIISFGNYYILFTFITILSFIILEKRKKK